MQQRTHPSPRINDASTIIVASGTRRTVPAIGTKPTHGTHDHHGGCPRAAARFARHSSTSRGACTGHPIVIHHPSGGHGADRPWLLSITAQMHPAARASLLPGFGLPFIGSPNVVNI